MANIPDNSNIPPVGVSKKDIETFSELSALIKALVTRLEELITVSKGSPNPIVVELRNLYTEMKNLVSETKEGNAADLKNAFQEEEKYKGILNRMDFSTLPQSQYSIMEQMKQGIGPLTGHIKDVMDKTGVTDFAASNTAAIGGPMAVLVMEMYKAGILGKAGNFLSHTFKGLGLPSDSSPSSVPAPSVDSSDDSVMTSSKLVFPKLSGKVKPSPALSKEDFTEKDALEGEDKGIILLGDILKELQKSKSPQEVTTSKEAEGGMATDMMKGMISSFMPEILTGLGIAAAASFLFKPVKEGIEGILDSRLVKDMETAVKAAGTDIAKGVGDLLGFKTGSVAAPEASKTRVATDGMTDEEYAIRVANLETGGNYKLTNNKDGRTKSGRLIKRTGALGAFQFTASSMEQLGYLKPGASRKGSSYNVLNDLDEDGNKIQGTNWNVSKTGHQYSQEEFLNSPEMQRQAMILYTEMNRQALKKGKDGKPDIYSRAKALGYNDKDIMAATHLKGVKGFSQWVEAREVLMYSTDPEAIRKAQAVVEDELGGETIDKRIEMVRQNTRNPKGWMNHSQPVGYNAAQIVKSPYAPSLLKAPVDAAASLMSPSLATPKTNPQGTEVVIAPPVISEVRAQQQKEVKQVESNVAPTSNSSTNVLNVTNQTINNRQNNITR